MARAAFVDQTGKLKLFNAFIATRFIELRERRSTLVGIAGDAVSFGLRFVLSGALITSGRTLALLLKLLETNS